jgi:hypothetical protein
MGRRGSVLRALACASIVAVITASTASAASPDAGYSDPTYTGTGIAGGGSRDTGVSAAVVAQKKADLEKYSRNALTPNRPAKTGGAKTYLVTLATISPAYASSASLGWYPGFHQKTNYYCLVAMVQSMAFNDLDNWYNYMGTGTITGAQDKIYNGGYTDPDGTAETGIKATRAADLPGSYDTLAIAWMNKQFSRYHYSFVYAGQTPASQSVLSTSIHYDVSGYREPTYVRVDLSSNKYKWYSAPDPVKGHKLHATAAVGYNDSASTINSYDPYASPSGSSCSAPSSTGNNKGCNWPILLSQYFNAMDRTVTWSPVWF